VKEKGLFFFLFFFAEECKEMQLLRLFEQYKAEAKLGRYSLTTLHRVCKIRKW